MVSIMFIIRELIEMYSFHRKENYFSSHRTMRIKIRYNIFLDIRWDMRMHALVGLSTIVLSACSVGLTTGSVKISDDTGTVDGETSSDVSA